MIMDFIQKKLKICKSLIFFVKNPYYKITKSISHVHGHEIFYEFEKVLLLIEIYLPTKQFLIDHLINIFVELPDIYFHICRNYKYAKKNSNYQKMESKF